MSWSHPLQSAQGYGHKDGQALDMLLGSHGGRQEEWLSADQIQVTPLSRALSTLRAPLPSSGHRLACEDLSCLPWVWQPNTSISQMMGPCALWPLPAGPSWLVAVLPPNRCSQGCYPHLPPNPRCLLTVPLRAVRICPAGSWQEAGVQGGPAGAGREI